MSDRGVTPQRYRFGLVLETQPQYVTLQSVRLMQVRGGCAADAHWHVELSVHCLNPGKKLFRYIKDDSDAMYRPRDSNTSRDVFLCYQVCDSNI